MATAKKFGQAALAVVLGATLMVPAASAFAADEAVTAAKVVQTETKKVDISKTNISYKLRSSGKLKIYSVTYKNKKLKKGTDYKVSKPKIVYYDAQGNKSSKKTKAATNKEVSFKVKGIGKKYKGTIICSQNWAC